MQNKNCCGTNLDIVENNKLVTIIKEVQVPVVGPKGDTGERGPQGYTPVVDPITQNWFINGVDTGILAGTREELVRVEDEDSLPEVGKEKVIYLTDDYKIFLWDLTEEEYIKLNHTPEESADIDENIEDIEDEIDELKEDLLYLDCGSANVGA